MRRRLTLRQPGKQGEDFLTVPEIAAGDFADDEIVDGGYTSTQKLGEVGLASPQTVDPDRGIDQDHLDRLPAPGNVLNLRLRAAQADEPAGALPLNQGAQRLLQERAAILEAAKVLCPGKGRIIDA